MLTTLFDKSFLQSLSVDESVWFDRHFTPVVCPVFYAETLADLALTPNDPAFAEREVSKIADKFPQMSGSPCASHFTMIVGDLLGKAAPMNGRVPVPGGRHIKSGERRGSGDNCSPRLHQRARNHHPSKVVITAVEKMIPSAARAITAGSRTSFA